jgi:hypothetical protein
VGSALVAVVARAVAAAAVAAGLCRAETSKQSQS